MSERLSQEPALEEFKDLPNVRKAIDTLEQRLEMRNPDWKSVQGDIYDMLTTRSEFVQLMEENGGDLQKALEGYAEERGRYNEEVRTALREWVDGSDGFGWESNPGWFGITTRPEAPPRGGVSIKAYVTIPVEQYGFVEGLPALAEELRKLSLDSDDIIQVKVPENFATFLSKNDSIVVHYKNPENADRIGEILNKWMAHNNIQEEPREMGRVKTAADSKDGSFSDLVAKNIAGWLRENHGKYSGETLARLAVEHAIRQSQTPPSIKGA